MSTSRSKQQLIDELQAIILKTLTLIDRFEQKEMQEMLPVDYAHLYEILERSTQQQRVLQRQLIDEGEVF